MADLYVQAAEIIMSAAAVGGSAVASGAMQRIGERAANAALDLWRRTGSATKPPRDKQETVAVLRDATLRGAVSEEELLRLVECAEQTGSLDVRVGKIDGGTNMIGNKFSGGIQINRD